MDIDATFGPVADLLVNDVFPTAIVYQARGNGIYNPETGEVTGTTTDYAINAGVLSRTRVEEGGAGEVYELMLWVEHKTLPVLPKTGDTVAYDGTTWVVVEVAPTYSSKGLIASKLKARG
jgi:hypothetical protein